MKATKPTRATSGRPDLAELRKFWQQAQHDKSPRERADAVLDRLERKYEAIADAARAPK